jgi:glucosamine kinase
MVLNWYYQLRGSPMAFLIAVDGGGTSCRAIIATYDGTALGEGIAGSANIVTDPELALANIIAAACRAAEQAGLPGDAIFNCAAVLGLAGANIGAHASRFASRLPFRLSHIETDARIALQGALGEMDGAVAVVGTGSVFLSRQRGSIRSIGGWGPAVGDFCSGQRLGRTLLEQVLRAYDGLLAHSELTQGVMARFNDDPGALVDFAQAAKPRDFASFAPLLFEYADRCDAVAGEIVTAAVSDLDETLRALIEEGDLPFSLLGGLASNYSRRLAASLKSRERPPNGNALGGALAMAVSMFGRAEGGARLHG